MFTDKEKEVLRSLIKFHLDELKKDKKSANLDAVAAIGTEQKYEEILKKMLEKLK